MNLFEYDEYVGKDVVLCGVDEAGRGPLAGDVYACAVILPDGYYLEGINDSKKLSEKKREQLYEILIKEVEYSVGIATVEEIETLDILKATMLSMRRAVEGLSIKPEHVLVDGNKNPMFSPYVKTDCVIGGDAKSASIAVASIIAKVERDRYMKEMGNLYPNYLFEKHNGYGTKVHYQKLDEFGACAIHRQSFLKKYYTKKKIIIQDNTGEYGEDYTYDQMKKDGYTILDRNYSTKQGEVDIIAVKDNVISFVEVKTRDVNSIARPIEFVSKSKQLKIIKTAVEYYTKNNYKGKYNMRFDIAEVITENKQAISYKLVINAFTGDGTDVYF